MMSNPVVRIFISSPGDVHEEREIARGVVQQLGRTFAGRVQLQAVLWEDLPLKADSSFQQGIDLILSEQGVDIAVFILWSRLGSPTGSLMTGQQGKPYRSGTHREWHLMLLAREESVKRGQAAKPDIIVYTRNDEVSFEERLRGKTDDAKAADIQQKMAVNQFIKEEFHDAESGTNLRAFHSFDQPTTFAKQLRTHLTGLLESLCGSQLEKPVWDIAEQGPPFRGLDTFEFEHSPVFFGREDEIVAIRNRLREQACRGCAFLLISGPSGTGKSSLARAGVLPDICHHEVDEKILSWRRLLVKPGQLGEDLMAGLVNSLLQRDVLPELAQWSEDLNVPESADAYANWRAVFVLRVKDALKACNDHRGGTRLIVLLDQMEELFARSIPHSVMVQFFEAIEALAQSGLVWVVATVRSDFYQECLKVPALVRMKGSVTYDLTAPGPDALLRVVTGPAKLAGLKFDKKGETSLADVILRESADRTELLPLVEYLLLDLFEHRTPEGVLPFSRFEELGGVEGALRQRCEATFRELPAPVQAKLPAVLSKLVTLSGDDMNSAVRRTVPMTSFEADPHERQFIEAMVNQRLCTSSSDSDGSQVVSVTHEAVLRVWPRIVEWISQNRNWLRIRGCIEQSLTRWKQEPDNSLLLAKGVPLREGSQLLAEAAHLLDDETRGYIEQSQAYHTRQERLKKRAIVGASLALCGLLLVGTWVALRTRARIQAAGLVDALSAAGITEVKGVLEKLEPYRTWAEPMLAATFANAPNDSSAKLNTALAMNTGEHAADESLGYLKTRAIELSPEKLGTVRELLAVHRADLCAGYWSIAMDSSQANLARFHAGCYLAEWDREHESWNNPKWCEFLATQLVTVSPSFLSHYQELFRPIKEHLFAPLSEIFKDVQRTELARSFATTLLADYAADNAEVLTDLVISADPAADKQLFPILKARHRDAAVKKLEVVLNTELKPDWHDPPLDPTWQTPAPEVKAAMESAGGLIDERFAFCQSMLWDEFLKNVESLRPCGYTPTRVRPWLSDEQVHVAAVWQRDGRKWKLETISRRGELHSSNEVAFKDNMLIEDVSRMPSTVKSETRWLALWTSAAEKKEQRRVVIDATAQEIEQLAQRFTDEGFASQQTLTVANNDAGQRIYCGIWSNLGPISEFRLGYDGEEFVYQPQMDVCVALSEKLPSPIAGLQNQLKGIAQLPENQRNQPATLAARAMARYQTGNIASALNDWDNLIQQGANPKSFEPYRTIALARVKKETEAQSSLEEFLKGDVRPSFKTYARVQVSAWLGRFDEAWDELLAAELLLGSDNKELYNLVCATAVCTQAAREIENKESNRFTKQTYHFLDRLIEQGYRNGAQLVSDPDFAAIYSDDRFQAIVTKLIPPAHIAAFWAADQSLASRCIELKRNHESKQHLEKLLASKYRPHSLAVDKDGARLLLHLPNIPDAHKEQLAIAQASAATALLRLDAASQVWPWLDDRPDPRMRSYLMDRLARVSVDAATLKKQLSNETSEARQRSLILGLGELAKADLLTDEQKQYLTNDLVKRYVDDPDSGVHGAAEWALKQLKAEDKIAEVQKAFAKGEPQGERRWYLIKSDATSRASPITMVIIDAQEPFLMGSPITEAERIGGATGRGEILHHQEIGRRYALSSHEVTVAQFLAFRPRHDFSRDYSPEPNSPVNTVTWYDAAAYCNWLSEQAGIPREQWCYDPDQPFAEGMTLLPDYLRRTGFRLASEAEWEFACRAGTATSRYFGETEALLGEYAWYAKVSGDKDSLPVSTLRPNPLGLFDMLGNMAEWTQDRALFYSNEKAGDLEELSKLSNSEFRVLRGGSFDNHAPNVRSAARNTYRPVNGVSYSGFRLSRTCP